MWKKIQNIWLFISSIFLSDYDYFLVGGDDLYVVVDNVKLMLDSPYIRNKSNNNINPLYIGKTLNQNKYLNFNSGGAGYILNSKALLVLMNNINNNSKACMSNIQTSMEDVMVSNCLFIYLSIYLIFYLSIQVSNCLMHAGIFVTPYLDEFNIETFHPLSPVHLYYSGTKEIVNQEDYGYKEIQSMGNNNKYGSNCCSAYSNTFHYIKLPYYNMNSIHDYLYCNDKY
jgi:glycoprotein-N-acetylgalactosamine 3-beta-galactosyltransferase